MTTTRSRLRNILGGLVLVLGCLPILYSPLSAQSRKPRPDSPANLTALDNRATEIEQQYVAGLFELATGYEEAGQIDKARATLEEILKIEPDAEAVKTKLRELEEAVFDANLHTVEVDVAKGWVTTNILLTKDEPIRFSADGTYRYIVNETVGPAGFSQEDMMRDMAAGVPSGALMGLILPAPRPGQRQPPEPNEPFVIGASSEFTPEDDGALLLRINLPQGHKCVGKIKVNISGNIRPLQ